MRLLEPHEMSFPYGTPYSRLPWRVIERQTDLPLDEWVWVSDRLHNIYPAARTARGLEVPPNLNIVEMQRAGFLDLPRYWLPFKPDRLTELLAHVPAILRFSRPAHG